MIRYSSVPSEGPISFLTRSRLTRSRPHTWGCVHGCGGRVPPVAGGGSGARSPPFRPRGWPGTSPSARRRTGSKVKSAPKGGWSGLGLALSCDAVRGERSKARREVGGVARDQPIRAAPYRGGRSKAQRGVSGLAQGRLFRATPYGMLPAARAKERALRGFSLICWDWTSYSMPNPNRSRKNPDHYRLRGSSAPALPRPVHHCPLTRPSHPPIGQPLLNRPQATRHRPAQKKRPPATHPPSPRF
ncbi:hypothetical protein Sros_0405 [Streptosporangium roseum DSM 43021]|uniref:Uncharacterized protein n=1 Tax=Streptosporangium roseum (strain ATCC 12428 / DSM 43021 / JCM 3005 / KCTC 9067 / NCIMB 10171 / NRRL 2505 / NI 9100) TaxID=479432 RepID=D2B127_STRRD|nr:hypothetical protein Sros_0405 [Streptosporangium roseum DSM 43021]